MPGRGVLLIDLDGVVRLWPPVDTGLPAGTIEAVAFELAHAALTGAMSDGAWREAIVARLATEFGTEPARVAVRAWSQVGALDVTVLELIRRVRSRTPVWLATNATSRLPMDLAALGLDQEVDGVVNSSEVGAAKPAEAFFRAAIGLAGPVALFVDDSPGHCEAASRLGLATHSYSTSERLRVALHDADLLP